MSKIYKGNVTSWGHWLELKAEGYTSIGGGFDCSNNPGLTSLVGAPESIGGWFNCSNNPGLTSLVGAPESIGGGFNCYNNPGLTSLVGAPESIGGWFDCYNNPGLTSLVGAPKANQPQPNLLPRLSTYFLAKGMIFCDGILSKKISVKIKAEVTIYKTAKLGFKKNAPIVYVCVQGGISAHGDTVKGALEELAFKTSNRDTEQYKNMPMNTKKTPSEWAFIYRMITGACQTGTRMFMEQKKLKKNYTLEEILEETSGAFGHVRFREVVGA